MKEMNDTLNAYKQHKFMTYKTIHCNHQLNVYHLQSALEEAKLVYSTGGTRVVELILLHQKLGTGRNEHSIGRGILYFWNHLLRVVK